MPKQFPINKSVVSLGKTLAPTLERAAPGIIQGAAKGAAVGGPWAALLGAGAGIASAALRKPRAPLGVPDPAGTQKTAPEVPSAPELPIGQGAAATLLALLQNPTVQQSLLSQVLGSHGREQVRTPSGVNLPRAAINSLLTQLLANATEALPESESISEQSYLIGESGEYLVDPASPDQHAALVLSYLQPAALDFTEMMGGPKESMGAMEWVSEESENSESADWCEFEESGETVEFYR
jgi:hypothetical protein